MPTGTLFTLNAFCFDALAFEVVLKQYIVCGKYIMATFTYSNKHLYYSSGRTVTFTQ